MKTNNASQSRNLVKEITHLNIFLIFKLDLIKCDFFKYYTLYYLVNLNFISALFIKRLSMKSQSEK